MGRIYFGNAENIGRKLKALGSATSPRVNVLTAPPTQAFEYLRAQIVWLGDMRVVQPLMRSVCALAALLCAEHVQHLKGESPAHLMELKG